MDLRAQKTQKAIINAFLTLRAKKPLNKITVTELAKEAMISKATFYLHYSDIYDLSERLQDRLVLDIVGEIPHPERMYTAPDEYSRALITAFEANSALTDILFSDDERNRLAEKLEEHIKASIYSEKPQLRENIGFDIALSMIIHGSFHAYRRFMGRDPEATAEWISRIAKVLTEFVAETQKGQRQNALSE